MRFFYSLLLGVIVTAVFQACISSRHMEYQLTKNYKPDDQALYDTIVKLDAAFFGAYNNCATELEKYASFFSDSIEFYHDKGGLMTSKQAIIDATQRNVCGKVTRALIPGSIEVYPIKEYGAVEIGLHKFYNNQDPSSKESRAGRFTVIWKKEKEGWRIRRVISLH